MSGAVMLSILIAGLFSSNIIASSGVGVDFATNNLSTIKNSVIYSIVIFFTAIFATICIYVANLALVASGLSNFLIVVALLIVSVSVQISEFMLKKLLPLFFTQTKYFVPSLVSTLFIMVVSAFGASQGFFELLFVIFCQSLGVLLVLAIIAGIRQTNSIQNKPTLLKGNLMSLVILLFVMLAWTAF